MTPNGTPKTLGQALTNGLAQVISRPANSFAMLNEQSPATVILQDHIRDFVSQKFTIYMVQYPDSSSILKSLYDTLFRENHEPEQK